VSEVFVTVWVSEEYHQGGRGTKQQSHCSSAIKASPEGSNKGRPGSTRGKDHSFQKGTLLSEDARETRQTKRKKDGKLRKEMREEAQKSARKNEKAMLLVLGERWGGKRV